ncbi:hypothetical protein F2Q69_00027489 [Brassica cretica]|uniref:Uncharacterized protein n=1 Tax=Brassica cretica TaxID=69181 RepID=A0A8S9RZX2_BRACR|nr:hypothetical protein F2Q69_00027489 [Brassica cretica]
MLVGASCPQGHLARWGKRPVGASGPHGHLVRKDICPVGASGLQGHLTSGPLGRLVRWDIWSFGTSSPLGYPADDERLVLVEHLVVKGRLNASSTFGVNGADGADGASGTYGAEKRIWYIWHLKHSGAQGFFALFFSMGLSEDSVRVFTVFLRAIYMMVFLSSVKDVAEGLKEIDSCGYVFGVTHSFLLELICENEELLVQGRVRLNRWRCQIEIDSGWKHVCFGFSAWDSVVVCFDFLGHMRGETNGSTWYHRAAVQSDVQGKVFIQIVTKEILRMMSSAGASSSVREKIWRSFVVNNNGVRDRGRNVHRGLSQCTRWFQVGEIMMRDLQGMQRYFQERGDSRNLKGKQTHSKSKLDLRRWNQRSSISQGLKVFRRSQGMQVILAKDDQLILQLHRTTAEQIKQTAWDSVVVCFGFSGHMRGKQMGLQGITVAEKRFRVMFKARIESKCFWFEAMVIQVLQKLQVSIDINWKFWRRSRYVVTIATTTASETEEETFTEDYLSARDGFRLSQRKMTNGSCSCTEESQRSHQVSVTETWCTSTKRKLEQGKNTQKRSKEHQSGVTTISVKVELSDKNRSSKAKGEICRLDRVGTSCLNKSGFKFSYSLRNSSWVRFLTREKLDPQAQAEPLGGGSFHGFSWRDRGLYTHDRESNDLVNHIEGVFRYFIVDVVDPGSTPDIARCGRELGEQFLSHEQG